MKLSILAAPGAGKLLETMPADRAGPVFGGFSCMHPVEQMAKFAAGRSCAV
jgi:hypothetical protein